MNCGRQKWGSSLFPKSQVVLVVLAVLPLLLLLLTLLLLSYLVDLIHLVLLLTLYFPKGLLVLLDQLDLSNHPAHSCRLDQPPL